MLQQIFLSYTYAPHPVHSVELALLESATRRIVEAMGCRVIDGKDLGGGGLTLTLEARIVGCDALIALVTPQTDAVGTAIAPSFVESEMNFARGTKLGKGRTIAVIHPLLKAAGLYAGDEHINYAIGDEISAILKLAATINLWRRTSGQSIDVRIDPADLASRFDEDHPRHRCEYRIRTGNENTGWTKTGIWPQQGGAFVHIPNMQEESLVRVRVELDAERWLSEYVSPRLAGIKLERAP